MNSDNMTQRLKAARFMTQQPEAARFMTQRPEAARIKRYRRFHGYDYSRGASIFVTFAVKGRLPLFGRVEGDKVVLSPAGRAALEAILFENRRPGRRVWAASHVVMPDHIHIRLVLEPGSGEEPLRHVGQFVNNVKRWARKHAAEIGVEVEWEPNYHDHICVSRFSSLIFSALLYASSLQGFIFQNCSSVIPSAMQFGRNSAA